MAEIITSEIELSGNVISSGLTVETGGVVSVLSGATVTDTEAVNYGYLWVEDGGLIQNISLHDSGGAMLSGGSAENVTMTNGGQMDVFEGVWKSGTILDKGYGMVYDGGSGLNVTVSNGGRYLVYGGYVGDTVVESGGSFTIQMSGGIAANTTVNWGAHARVVSGAQGSKTAVNGGRLEMLYGYMYDTTISGGEMEIISGQAYNTDVNAGGTLYVAAAGEAHTAIVNGGYLNVQSGTVYDANIQRAGSALLQDAAAFRFNLNGGTAQALSGTVITEGDLNGGTLDLGSGAILLNANLNGAALNAEAGALVSKSFLRHTGTNLDVSSGVTFRKTRITAGTMSVQAGATVEGTTVSDSGILAVRESASVEGTTVNLGGQFVLGGTAHSVVLNGSSFTTSSGSSTVYALSSDGGRMQVSGGYAADVQVYGGTLGVSGGLVSGLTMSKGEITIGAGGAVRGAALQGIAEYSRGWIVFTDPSWILVSGTGGGFADTAFAGYGGSVPVLSGDTLSLVDVDGPQYPIFITGSTVPALGYLTVEAGGLLEDAEASWMRITVSGDGVARNLSATNYTLITLASGGTLTGRMSFVNGTTVTAAAGGIVDFDLTNLAPGNEVILNGLNAITGAPTFTVTVSDVQATGRYVLADGVNGFSGTLTVRNTAWAALGTLTVGELTEIGGRYYLAKTKYDTLYLSIWTERPEILPDPNPVYLNTTWTGLEAGTSVALADGGTATFGYDAFADLAAASEAVAENGLVLVTGCEAALPGVLTGTVDVAAGASVTGATVGERGTLTLKNGASARDIAVSGGTLTVEAGAVLTVTQKFNASGTITVDGIVNLDISGSAGSTDALINRIADIQGAATYRLTVGESQAAGGYKLVATPNGYEDFTLTVVDASGNALGTVGIRYVQQADGSYQEIKTDAVINGMRYSLVCKRASGGFILTSDAGFTLSVTPETEKPYYLYVNFDWNTLAVGSTVGVTNPDTNLSYTATYGVDAFYDLAAAEEFGDENCVITVSGGTFSPAAGVTRNLVLTYNTSGIIYVVVSAAIILENTTVYRSVTAKSVSLVQDLTVAAGGSVTVSGGTAKSLTVAAGAALTVTSGVLTGYCTFEAGSEITVSGGMMAFDISGAAAGGPALYDGLAYVAGTPNCAILISADQAQGVYVLGTNAAGFAPYFTIQEKTSNSNIIYYIPDASGATPRKPNVITIGGTYRVNGKSYTIAETDGVLTLTVGTYEMPETVYINSTWDGLAFGETVTLQSGASATYGVDAFGSAAAAHAASAEGAAAYIDGGIAVLNDLDNEKTRKTVARAGSVVRGGTGSTRYAYDLTLESGATADSLTVYNGTLTVKSGATLAGDTKTGSGFTIELHDGAVLGGTLSAEGKTVLRDVTALGGTVVISASGTLTGTAAFTEDMDITVNGTIDFDISGTTAGAPMLFRGLSCLKGAPASYSITIDIAQEKGVYLLADAVDNFSGSIALRNVSGTTLGTIEIGKSVNILGVYYTLRGLPSDGKYFLSLVVSNERPPLESVTVNSSWSGKQAGEIVNIRGGTAIYLYDAFANLNDAFAVGVGATVNITGGNFQLSEGSHSNPVVVDGATLSLTGTDVLTGSVSVIQNGILAIAGEAAASASITVDGTSTLLMSGPSNAGSITVDGTIEFDISRAGGKAVFENLSRIQGAPTYAIRAAGALATGTYLVATGASGVGRVELRLGSNKYALSTAGGFLIVNGIRYEAALTSAGDLTLDVSKPDVTSVYYLNTKWYDKKDGDVVETIDGGTAIIGYNAFWRNVINTFSPGSTVIIEGGGYGSMPYDPVPQRGVNVIIRKGSLYMSENFSLAPGCVISVAAIGGIGFHQSFDVAFTVESGATFTVEVGGKLALYDGKIVIRDGANVTVNGTIRLSIARLTGGCDARISDLSRIQGAPSSFELRISDIAKQSAGKYVLASGAAGFDGVITVLDFNVNKTLATLSVGDSYMLGRKTCTLELDETGDLCLNVVDPDLAPTVYLNAEWAGLDDDAIVLLPKGGTAWVGYDAFSKLEDAASEVAERGTIVILGGTYQATPVDFGDAVRITVRGGELNMDPAWSWSTGFGKTVTVEDGGTISGAYTFMSGGSLAVNDGGIATGRIRTGYSGTITVQGGGMASGVFEIESGGTLTVEAGAVLSVECSAMPDEALQRGAAHFFIDNDAIVTVSGQIMVEDDATIRIDGTLCFDISGIGQGGAALFRGLSRVEGTPSYVLTVSETQAAGRYVLSSDAAGFDGVITVRNDAGTALATLTAGQSFLYERKEFKLILDTLGNLCLTVSRPDGVPCVHISTEWEGVAYGKTVTLADGSRVSVGVDAFADEGAFYEVGKGGMAVLWDGTVSTGALGNANSVVIRGGELKLNGAVESARTITVTAGGTLSGDITIAAGGAITVEAGGTLTVGRTVLDDGASLFVNGILNLDMTGAAADGGPLFRGFARVQGAPNFALTVGGLSQGEGVYTLSEDAGLFDGIITVLNSDGEELGKLEVGKTLYATDGNAYHLSSDNMGKLELGVTRLVETSRIYLNSDWEGLEDGAFVVLQSGYLAVIGVNAFYNDAAFAAVSDGGTVVVEKGRIPKRLWKSNLNIIVLGEAVLNTEVDNGTTITVGTGASLSGAVSAVREGCAITVEEGGTFSVSFFDFQDGASIVNNGVMDLDISVGLRPGSLNNRSGFHHVRGNAEFTLTVSSGYQMPGEYLYIGDSQIWFYEDLVFTVVNTDGETVGTLSIGHDLEYNGNLYTFVGREIVASGILHVYRFMVEKIADTVDLVYVNSLWAGLEDGTTVEMADGSTATIGYDAFAEYVPGKKLSIVGGTVTLPEDAEVSVITVKNGAVLNGNGAHVNISVLVDVGSYAENLVIEGSVGRVRLENGATLRNFTIRDGTLEAGSGIAKLSGRMTIEGTFNTLFFTVVDFDLSVADDSRPLLNDLRILTFSRPPQASTLPTRSYTITVDADTVPASGSRSYKLAGNAEAGRTNATDDAVFTVVNRDGSSIGTIALDGSLNIGDAVYKLRIIDDILTLTVSAPDNAPPKVFNVNADTVELTNRDVVVTAEFSDDQEMLTAYYRIGANGEWLAYDFENGVTVTKNATVYFKAVDDAGNVSEIVSYTVNNIDNIAPKKPGSLRASVSEHMVVLAWNPSEDAGSGIDEYIVRYWNGEHEFTVSTNRTTLVIEDLGAGTWHWTVHAFDKAWNASEIAEGDAFSVTGEAVPEADKRFFLGDFAGDGTPMFAKYAGGIVSVYAENGALWGAVALGDGWEPVGIGDFDGDGRDDVLRINAAGYVVGEMSNGDGTFTAQVLNFKDAAWDILGIGDFDGDGKDDVLVANPTGASETVGLIGYWKAGTEWTLINGYSASWEMIATGDFDGDGKCDMLWKNSFLGADGKTYNAYCSWIVGNPVDWRMVSVANPEEWNFLCAGDFDGDGTKDIAMVNGEGVVGIWGMSDGWLASWSILSKVDASEWSLVGVADLNGDGTDDIAWRSAESGLAGYWQINNKQMAGWQTVSALA